MLAASHSGEELLNILKLLRHRHLWLDHVEQEGGRHDGTTVHHGVMRLALNILDVIIMNCFD